MSVYNDNLLYRGKYRMTSDFGLRIYEGIQDNHKGMDFVGDESKNILSPVDGVVMSSTIITDKSNLTWQWGNYVRIDSGDYKYYFCHMSKRLVSVGQTVKKGDVIGIEGETGYSFGSHCHLEIRDKNNVSIDPKTILWKEKEAKDMTTEEAEKIIQEKVGLDDNTIQYLKFYRYGEALLLKLAEALK